MIENPRLKMTDSELPGFYRLPMPQRRELVAEIVGLDPQQQKVLSGVSGLSVEQADQMVENALGVFGLPVGLCANLRVNGRDRLVPMCVEEPSVVAAASHAAKLLRGGAGIVAEVSEPLMIGQVQLMDVPDLAAARAAIHGARDELLSRANSNHPRLLAAGGGARDLEIELLEPMECDDPLGPMLVVHLVVDVQDAMGANSINTMCETLADRLAELSGGRACLRILSNLTDRRVVRVTGRAPVDAIGGKSRLSSEAIARGIEEASVFAERDPYRAATHNKGIMNGVDAVLVAFGQDFRAVEAGAHAFAAREGDTRLWPDGGFVAITSSVRWRSRWPSASLVAWPRFIPTCRSTSALPRSSRLRSWPRSRPLWGSRRTWARCGRWLQRVSNTVTCGCMLVTSRQRLEPPETRSKRLQRPSPMAAASISGPLKMCWRVFVAKPRLEMVVKSLAYVGGKRAR